ncbi:MAG: type III secretion system export apparatus subunit SctR [Rhodobacteraceae bacterium]|jgi:type III secretion protein R|nr:type III secretion system export apparatus subunit SctR [Paracoccaceae bacterium]
MEDLPAFIPTILAVMSLTLLPFLAVMGTAFTKISIVLMLLRNAMGVQQAPSGLVLNSLALTLTAFIMAPIGESIIVQLREENLVLKDWDSTVRIYDIVSSNFVGYLTKFTTERELAFFMSAAHELWPETMHHHIHDQNLFLLLPAHVTSEITKAFQIAFLLFLPFVIIDMVVSNILLAMGAMMVPPMLVSLPLKILLFVAVDGWARLLQALVLSYA